MAIFLPIIRSQTASTETIRSDVKDLRSDVRTLQNHIYDLNGKVNRVIGYIESIDSPSVGQTY